VLGLKVLAVICGRLTELHYALRWGMPVERPDGTTGWIRPATAVAIASRLGIGPDAKPGRLA
jgi:hypothetical protein